MQSLVNELQQRITVLEKENRKTKRVMNALNVYTEYCQYPNCDGFFATAGEGHMERHHRCKRMNICYECKTNYCDVHERLDLFDENGLCRKCESME